MTLVGFWSNVFRGGLADAVATVESAPHFTTSIDSGVLYGTPTLDDYIYKTGRITRAEALRVPAVKRARDLIAGAIGQFPLRVYGPDGKLATTFSPNIVTQPEAGVPAAITWTRVVEDLLFEGRAWMKVTAVAWHGRPAEVRRLDAESVNLQPELVRFPEGVATVWPERSGLIRIDSPNPGILDNSPAIRACVAINRAALNAVNGVPPMDFFTDRDDDADPLEADEVESLLSDWETARKNRSTAYVPRALEYNIAGWDPAKLQLAEARREAVLEVARLTGIDPEELGVSTTSRTYFNSQDRRRQRTEDVYGPYMTAIESRLAMDDVTPYGYTSSFDTSAYLRLDDLTAAQTDAVLITSKVLTPDEARSKRGLDPLGVVAEPDPVAVAAAVSSSLVMNGTDR